MKWYVVVVPHVMIGQPPYVYGPFFTYTEAKNWNKWSGRSGRVFKVTPPRD